MLRKIVSSVFLIIAFSINAYADNVVIRNDDASTQLFPTNMGSAGPMAADAYGRIFARISDGTNTLDVIPVSNAAIEGLLNSTNSYFNVVTDTIEAGSTTTVLNLTAHVARRGDLIIPTGGTADNIDVAIPICSVTTNTVTLCYALPTTPSTDAIVIRRPNPVFSAREDSAVASGDPGILALAVNNETQATQFNTTNGDAITLGADRYGSLMTAPVGLGATAATILLSPVRAEDTAVATGQALMLSGAVNVTGQTVFNSTEGDATPIGVTGYGALYSNIGAFNNIISATTTVVKSGAGVFHRLCFNKKVATGVVTIYDNTSAAGTKIATITEPATLLDSQQCLEYDLRFGTGLTVVTSAADDITVVYN